VPGPILELSRMPPSRVAPDPGIRRPCHAQRCCRRTPPHSGPDPAFPKNITHEERASADLRTNWMTLLAEGLAPSVRATAQNIRATGRWALHRRHRPATSPISAPVVWARTLALECTQSGPR